VGIGKFFRFALIDQTSHFLRGPAAVGKKQRGAVSPDDLPEGLGEDGPPGGVHELLSGVRGKGDPDLVVLFVPGLDDGDIAFWY